MKTALKTIIPYSVRRFIWEIGSAFLNLYAHKSYSQEGEDMILRRIFEHQKLGFYVDVGAHHPKRFSNTYFFYKRGWKGINIDAMPGSMRLFRVYRPRDINIEAAISNKSEDLTYFVFNETALNTFDSELAQTRNLELYKLINKQAVKTQTLANVLKKYLPENQKIDIISIDVEGLDLNVLESNEWELFRPKCVLIEQAKFSLDHAQESQTYQFLSSRGYILFAKTLNTLIFLDKQYEQQRV
ncbi:MAG: FkbM family methyltransferase [Thainema sp.]